MSRQKLKGEPKTLSSRAVAEEIGKQFGVAIAESSLRRKVNCQGESNVGKNPCGRTCQFGKAVYNALTGAFVTMLTLNQSGLKQELAQDQVALTLSNLFDDDGWN